MESSVSVTTGALFDKERWMGWMNEMAGNRLDCIWDAGFYITNIIGDTYIYPRV